MPSSREQNLASIERIHASGTVTAADAFVLAQALLEIADVAMPESYLANDSRCQLARVVLANQQEVPDG